MKNEKGTVLIITLGFVLVFTMLGIASIHLAGVQNEVADKQMTSAHALWVADGGVEFAKTLVPPSSPYPHNVPDSFLTNTAIDYNATIDQCNAANSAKCGGVFNHRWLAFSTGTVAKATSNTKSRSIEAVISEFTINNAITANGTINEDCAPDGSADILGSCEQNAGVSLQNVFGLTYSNDHAGLITITDTTKSPPEVFSTNCGGAPNCTNITQNYTGSNYGNQPYTDLAIITSTTTVANNNGNKITNNSANPTFLIIDCSCPPSNPTCNPPNTCYKSTGNIPLHGIVWVIGNVDMQGTPSFSGSLFVENGSFNGNLNGNNVVQYDEDIVEGALNVIGSTSTKKPTIVAWKEI